MHDKRGWMAVAMVLGTSFTLATGCDDVDDSAGDLGMDEDEEDRDEPDDGEVTREDDGGEVRGCALNETTADCMAELGCSPVFGNALVDDGNGGWCTEVAQQYIGCVTTLNLCNPSDKFPCEDPCPSVDKVVCGDDEVFWHSSGCVPQNLEVCGTPDERPADC